MRNLLLILTALILTACAATHNYYSTTVQSWRGGHISTLINRWGQPDAKYINHSGQTEYVYRTASYSQNMGPSAPLVGMNVSGNRPAMVTQTTNFAASRGGLNYNCYTAFITNKQGIIVDIHKTGQGCYGSASFAKQKSNPDQH